ncbi:hypothetical protein ACFLXT_00070 [Chloroflexota bacterium]
MQEDNDSPNTLLFYQRCLSKATGVELTTLDMNTLLSFLSCGYGLPALPIMRLGRWSSLDMVSRYCRNITFDDCLKQYKQTTD